MLRCFQKAYDKAIKPKSYTLGDKIWMNSKYIRVEENWKLNAKFFKPFLVLYLVEKQVYKLKLPKRQRIHDVFYMSPMEQDITKKKWVDKATFQLKFDNKKTKSDNYEVDAICNSAVHTKGSDRDLLPGFHYMLVQKNYRTEENTSKPTSVIQHLLDACQHLPQKAPGEANNNLTTNI